MNIKNENDFLGFLISIKQDNGNISASHILNKSGLNHIDCLHYLKSLQSKGFVEYMDTDTYHIYPDGISAYMPPSKKLFSIIRNVTLYLLGLISPYVLEALVGIIKKFLLSD